RTTSRNRCVVLIVAEEPQRAWAGTVEGWRGRRGAIVRLDDYMVGIAIEQAWPRAPCAPDDIHSGFGVRLKINSMAEGIEARAMHCQSPSRPVKSLGSRWCSIATSTISPINCEIGDASAIPETPKLRESTQSPMMFVMSAAAPAL